MTVVTVDMGNERTRARHRDKTQDVFAEESEALDQIAKQAEARLAARRQARYEARNIQMRELEKKQKEDEDTTTNNHTGVNSSSSGPHSLIQHTSSNSNHNNSNIHSAAGKSGFFHSMHSCRVQ